MENQKILDVLNTLSVIEEQSAVTGGWKMSNERLEEIKLKFNFFRHMPYVPYEDVKFLIEQVERVKELESRNKQLQKQVQELKEQNERYRKAFESRYPDLLDESKKIKELEKENRRLKAFYEYWEELYGQGLEIANWHLNGNLESFDSFFEDALEKMGGYNKQRRNK